MLKGMFFFRGQAFWASQPGKMFPKVIRSINLPVLQFLPAVNRLDLYLYERPFLTKGFTCWAHNLEVWGGVKQQVT